ncbi:MAG TPA: hypothetical protein VFQ68_37555, partial [Streptosporangiaceae bacterium]|nr:hypothetical protein [Streptosporangiaceae bacterium]
MQFAVIPADDEPAPPGDEPAPPGDEPVTEQFPAISAEIAEAPAAAEPVTPEPVAAEPVAAEPAAPEPAAPPPAGQAQGHVRVDARLLEAALLNLRKRIAAIPLVF